MHEGLEFLHSVPAEKGLLERSIQLVKVNGVTAFIRDLRHARQMISFSTSTSEDKELAAIIHHRFTAFVTFVGLDCGPSIHSPPV